MEPPVSGQNRAVPGCSCECRKTAGSAKAKTMFLKETGAETSNAEKLPVLERSKQMVLAETGAETGDAENGLFCKSHNRWSWQKQGAELGMQKNWLF